MLTVRMALGPLAVSLFSLICLNSAFAQGFVSDSLVNNLQCSTLTLDSVLKSLQPDAFSAVRHLPVRNWASGHGLAECWSLAHAQRLFFYMGRFTQGVADSARFDDVETALGDFGGHTDSDPQVFAVGDMGSFFGAVAQGYLGPDGRLRNFRKAIEKYEDWRFYQPGNIETVIGDRDRDPATNARTFEAIEKDLDAGRLPIVIIRSGLLVQHAVIVKRMIRPEELPEEQPEVVGLEVYNSNTPSQDDVMTYDPRSREFYAPSIIQGLGQGFGVDPYPPVGIFGVDDRQMDGIQKSLLAHYRRLCMAAQDGG